MSSPTVSVLIPTYNRASFLSETLGSVFRQTLPPYEVILIDDGSTDDTAAVVQSLSSTHPDWAARLRFVRQQNKGKSAALNAALPLARGEWIAFNDSDDTWMPEKLEQQFAAFKTFPTCLASFTETTLNEFNDRHPEFRPCERGPYGIVEEPSQLYPVEWPGTYMQTVVVRADVLRTCGAIDERYLLSQDVDFMFRLGLLTSFCYVNLPLVRINRDPDRAHGLMSSYPSRSWTAMLENESMLHKWLSMVDQSKPVLRRIVRHELASSRSALANRYILAGDVTATRQTLRKALRDSAEPRLLMKWALAQTMPALFRRYASGRAPAEFFQNADEAGSATTPLGNS